MEFPKIDDEKLPLVKKIIDEINYFVVDEKCDEESPEVKKLAQRLREVTGKAELGIDPFLYYSSYTTLEEAAAMALLPAPQKTGLSDAEIRELISKIASAEIVCSYGEAVNDYFLNLLELETGLDNITDYIYNPDEVGMDLHASVEDIINKILADRK